MLQVKRLVSSATLPRRATDGSAGYDLCATEDITVHPGDRALVSTGLSIRVPFGTYGRLAPRSGLAVKHGIHVGAGVIDADYRGDVKVLLFNLGHEPVTFVTGDRIAQLILETIATPSWVVERDDLDETERGEGGFGSTGA